MQDLFSNALSSLVSKHIKLSPSRRETLTWLAFLMIQQGTICLWRLAAYVKTDAHTASVRRRFYRFFQFEKLEVGLIARVIIDVLHLLENWRSLVPVARNKPLIDIVADGRWSVFALGFCTLRKMISAAHPDHVIIFLRQLISPNLPTNSLKYIPF